MFNDANNTLNMLNTKERKEYFKGCALNIAKLKSLAKVVAIALVTDMILFKFTYKINLIKKISKPGFIYLSSVFFRF